VPGDKHEHGGNPREAYGLDHLQGHLGYKDDGFPSGHTLFVGDGSPLRKKKEKKKKRHLFGRLETAASASRGEEKEGF